MLDEIIDSAKNGAKKAVEAVEDACHLGHHEKRKSIKDRAVLAMLGKVDECTECLPLFEEAGFSLVRFDFDVGLSPKLLPRFMINRVASEEEQKEALEKVRKRRVVAAIMKALFKAAQMHDVLRVGHLCFMGVEVNVSAMPTVKMIFGQGTLGDIPPIHPENAASPA